MYLRSDRFYAHRALCHPFIGRLHPYFKSSVMRTDEAKLLKRFARHRDEASFRQLYRLHTPSLFAMAVRLSRSHADAEELIQEAWCRAVEKFDSFLGRSAFRTWLMGILVNCYREAVRRDKKTLPASEDELEHLTDDRITSLPVTRQTPAALIDIEQALSKLPPGYREVVLLHDLNGYTHKEIARMLGVQEGTSKSQLKRGREHLRALLANAPESSRRTDQRGTS